MNSKDYSKSFSIIIGDKPKYLILGTMPGKVSLLQNQYYAHPQNSFWKILFQLFNSNFISDYSDKIKFLKENKIALWDVCQSCYRKGSLDSDIQKENPNKIVELIETTPSIQKIIFNGQKAEKLYFKHLKRINGINYFTMLSTSPANASYTFEQKLENWELAISIGDKIEN
ncbi:MAG: DNA-deoxyinosine glycosylase [Candidatus Marinimicrobia bacterium]|nr:DNA-deoxyinosine glycosylase [Candidatus Neomarinimicrobiota bacterium]